MFRILLFFSLIPLAIVLIVHWWFGARVLAAHGKRICRCDLKLWAPSPDDETLVHRAEDSAASFGAQHRRRALAEWLEKDPKAARSRESSRRFGIAIPPLGALVAVLAVLAGKIPVVGAIAIFAAAVAISAVMGTLSLAPELTAIARASRRMREQRTFSTSDDCEAISRCASAHAWDLALPPLLRLLQKR